MSNDKNSSTKGNKSIGEQIAESRKQIDALFNGSPAKIRVRAIDGTGYVGRLSAEQVPGFLKESRKNAFGALGLADAETLKRNQSTVDLAENKATVSQDALAE